jgi:hypothetical protein
MRRAKRQSAGRIRTKPDSGKAVADTAPLHRSRRRPRPGGDCRVCRFPPFSAGAGRTANREPRTLALAFRSADGLAAKDANAHLFDHQMAAHHRLWRRSSLLDVGGLPPMGLCSFLDQGRVSTSDGARRGWRSTPKAGPGCPAKPVPRIGLKVGSWAPRGICGGRTLAEPVGGWGTGAFAPLLPEWGNAWHFDSGTFRWTAPAVNPAMRLSIGRWLASQSAGTARNVIAALVIVHL